MIVKTPRIVPNGKAAQAKQAMMKENMQQRETGKQRHQSTEHVVRNRQAIEMRFVLVHGITRFKKSPKSGTVKANSP